MSTQAKNIIRNYKVRIAQFVFVILSITPCLLYSQQFPGIQWQKCVGGTGTESTLSILQTSDGGYIAVGTTFSSDGDFTSNHGNNGVRGNGGIDGWIGKFDSSGAIEWLSCLGGMGDEMLSSIIETNDGGYIAVGYTTSFDGDVSGQHGGVSPSIEYPCSDAWIIKLSDSGKIEWQKCFGGQGSEGASSIIQNTGKDKGYTIVGSTNLSNGDVRGYHQGIYTEYFADVWVVHFDSSGKIKWQKCLGGSDQDYGYSIIQDYDNGYVIAGATQSSDGDVVEFHGPKKYLNPDGWIVKLNDTGKIIWQKCLGGSGYTEFRSIIKTNDGGYAVAGSTNCTDGDVAGNHGGEDAWVVKLDSSGNIQWKKCYGGTKDDNAHTIIQTSDGGYAIAGGTSSTDENMPFNHGKGDAWVIKLDSSGSLQWQECLGGTGSDAVYSIVETSDGGYAIAGSSSSNDGDVTGQHGDSTRNVGDAWIIKLNGLDKVGVIPASVKDAISFSTYPNPAQNETHIKFFLANTCTVKISLFDDLGREAANIANGEFYQDSYDLPIDLGALPAGHYTLKVDCGGKVMSRSLNVVR